MPQPTHLTILIVALLTAAPAPGNAQHVYKCVDWKGAATFQTERCSDRDRIDRVYDTHAYIEVDGRAVRNFVGGSSAGGGLAPVYGQPMNSDGSAKSDLGCGLVTAATSRQGRHRSINTIRGGAELRSAHCNHARGPGG